MKIFELKSFLLFWYTSCPIVIFTLNCQVSKDCCSFLC